MDQVFSQKHEELARRAIENGFCFRFQGAVDCVNFGNDVWINAEQLAPVFRFIRDTASAWRSIARVVPSRLIKIHCKEVWIPLIPVEWLVPAGPLAERDDEARVLRDEIRGRINSAIQQIVGRGALQAPSGTPVQENWSDQSPPDKLAAGSVPEATPEIASMDPSPSSSHVERTPSRHDEDARKIALASAQVQKKIGSHVIDATRDDRPAQAVVMKAPVALRSAPPAKKARRKIAGLITGVDTKKRYLFVDSAHAVRYRCADAEAIKKIGEKVTLTCALTSEKYSYETYEQVQVQEDLLRAG